MESFTDHTELWADVKKALPDGGVVAISGYGGSGKTELGKKLGRDKPGIQLIQVDDYLNWPTTNEKQTQGEFLDNDGIYFESIYQAHFKPFRDGAKPVSYLVVEGVWLFSPERTQHFDYNVWVNKTLEDAAKQGMSRPGESEGWANWDIWVQKEKWFEESYDPKQYADAKYSWS